MGSSCFFRIPEIFLNGEDGGLGIQRIKNGFDQQQVDTAIYQSPHLFIIGVGHFVETDGPETGIVDIRGKGKCFIHRADGAGDEFLVDG